MMKRIVSCLIFLICFQSAFIVHAQPDTNDLATFSAAGLNTAAQQLSMERERSKTAIAALEKLQTEKQQQLQLLKFSPLTKKQIEEANLAIAIANANVDATQLTLTEVEQNAALSDDNIQDLQAQIQEIRFTITPANTEKKQLFNQLQARLSYERSLLKLQKSRIKVLTTTLNTAKKRLQLEQDWKSQVVMAEQAIQNNTRWLVLAQQETAIQKEQQARLLKLNELNNTLKVLEGKHPVNAQEHFRISMQIFEITAKKDLDNQKITLLKLNSELEELRTANLQTQSITQLNNTNQQTERAIDALQKTASLLRDGITLIGQHKQIAIQQNALRPLNAKELSTYFASLDTLQKQYQYFLTQTLQLKEKGAQFQDVIASNLRQTLSHRQGLPGFNAEEWFTLSQQILYIPNVILQYLKTLEKQTLNAFNHMPFWGLFLLFFTEAIWCIGGFKLRRQLTAAKKAVQLPADHPQLPSINISLLFGGLLRRTSTGVFIIGVLIIFVLFAGVPVTAYKALLYMALVWFGFQFVISLARLILMEMKPERTQQDVRWYRILKMAFTICSILTMINVLVHQLPIAENVAELFNRLALAFLLLTSLMLIVGWKAIPKALDPYISGPRHYLKRTMYILSALIPLIIFSNALLGLIGYTELAWTITRYEGLFLLVLAGYLIIQELLNDGLALLSKLLVNRLLNGWLWSQAFLKPIARILKIALFLSAGYILLMLYDWNQHSWLTNATRSLLHRQLFAFPGGEITPFILLELFILVCVLFWIAHWSREFAYRWLFIKTKDVGLRNSLAVFTQYTVVAGSIIIAFELIGFDLTMLKFIISFFALGIGFGMRDLANNFVSGVLLLIERPLRKHDLVTIGGNEGEVTHIGMRSLTVYTGDHSEVLIPNSEVFTKPFTNWTHQDSVVRTMFSIKTTTHDDPYLTQTTLLNVINKLQGILSDPIPEVNFKSVDGGLIEFEIAYFINLQTTPSRPRMRSKVLFAIWDQFKTLGIQIAHPQQDMHVVSLPTQMQNGSGGNS